MDGESEKLIKKQMKNPSDFKKFKKMVSETKAYNVPKSFTGELRPYQKIGYSWIVSNIRYNFGCILADDMGLGKTVQVLTAILHFKEMNPLPELTYYIYHGSNRTFPFEEYDIILTSYGVVRLDLDIFMDKTWFLCVIDEAQNIKNPNTQQTRAIKSVKAKTKIALTGTPIENKLTDYWSIFDFVNKGYLSSLDNFKANYVMRIERLEETKTLEKFKTITKPFVLRRLKTDDNIKDELPDKIVNDIYCSLTKKQILLYNAIMEGIFEDLEGKTGIERRGIILNIITGLKQACNHPAQYLRSDNPKISESGKMELLITILENILDMDEKVIIFTQYAQMGEIIQKLVSKKLKTDVLFLHGSLTQQKRAEVIERFQEDSSCKILVATLKTGGVGLNLTAAQNVIHYDLWWNPAIENQATDRVHRIGQKSDVIWLKRQ